ncbi:hypothetical protein [Actinokineospora bangkokensis]|uniref:Uncharacterized protein n=1 Tax=Actinokineospora bangkokensis TaxID=1193682 RepID=A0A1Q9LG73_9PSEU|nr:hypothetical protein [Actinokineospora bangkokensis]OLR90949.1 hypothetical protein BJP25_30835 [Actinokineospora bangkokensis]
MKRLAIGVVAGAVGAAVLTGCGAFHGGAAAGGAGGQVVRGVHLLDAGERGPLPVDQHVELAPGGGVTVAAA